jgi:hypothetical protein
MAFALVAAACDSTAETTTTTVVTEATAPASTETTLAPEPPPAEEFVYRIGLADEDLGLANFWNYYGPAGTIANSWVLGPTKPAVFRIVYPAIVIAPDVAAGRRWKRCGRATCGP